MGSAKRKLFVFIAVLGLLATALLPAGAGADGSDFASPLFGLATERNGEIFVADAGQGIVNLHGEVVAELPGVTAVSTQRGRSLWATVGAGESGEANTGQALYRVANGRSRLIVDLFEFEAEYNPDGGPIDSNPYDVETINKKTALVVDAGGNTLLEVKKKGNVDVVAVFPTELVSTLNLQLQLGCPTPSIPDLAFICETDMMPAESVPTTVAIGPDGYYYVGELKGFPGPDGESNIWRIDPDAENVMCGSSPQCTKVFDGGFTSIVDMVFGPDGRLYVVELDVGGWPAVEIFQEPFGGRIVACDLDVLECPEIADEIPLVTAITFDRDGDLWATRNALIPGLAEVFEVPGGP
ncbi:MAG: ScyD/ScyE family protein [Acidimicrobiales bacterium]|nr:ScyD/ScyE family protein [Acidimicrobiales bacterium]